MSQGIHRNDIPTSSRDTLLNSIRKVNWPTLLAGAAIGMIGVHLAAVKPTIDRITTLERQVSSVEVGIERVAAVEDDVHAANNLLTALNTQRGELAEARDSLAAIDALQVALQTEVDRAEQAEASLQRLTALNNQLIGTEPMRTEAAAAIDEVERLQADVIALATPTETASEKVATTNAALDDLIALQNRLIQTGEDTTRSANTIEELLTLQNRILSAEELATSAENAERLLALQNQLVVDDRLQLEQADINAEELLALQCMILSTGDLTLSAQNAERLIALQNQLVIDERLQLEQADANLEDMIVVQQLIAEQTRQIADSIDGLELLTDFQGEMNGQLAGLEDLRRQLTELILLETTVARAMEALEPLASMQNLRRLDEDEVRDVAREILERRRDRMARSGSKYDTSAPTNIEEPEIHRLVPEPPVEE